MPMRRDESKRGQEPKEAVQDGCPSKVSGILRLRLHWARQRVFSFPKRIPRTVNVRGVRKFVLFWGWGGVQNISQVLEPLEEGSAERFAPPPPGEKYALHPPFGFLWTPAKNHGETGRRGFLYRKPFFAFCCSDHGSVTIKVLDFEGIGSFKCESLRFTQVDVQNQELWSGHAAIGEWAGGGISRRPPPPTPPSQKRYLCFTPCPTFLYTPDAWKGI